MSNEQSQTYFEDVAHLMHWRKSISSASPEIQLELLAQIKEDILENANPDVVETYEMILRDVESRTEPKKFKTLLAYGLINAINTQPKLIILMGISLIFALIAGFSNLFKSFAYVQ